VYEIGSRGIEPPWHGDGCVVVVVFFVAIFGGIGAHAWGSKSGGLLAAFCVVTVGHWKLIDVLKIETVVVAFAFARDSLL